MLVVRYQQGQNQTGKGLANGRRYQSGKYADDPRGTMKPRPTYANVMSTIAMFAALTTGGAYAAVTLKANSVTSRHIENGQVALVDLAPAVRKKLNATTGTTPTGTVPATWTDRSVFTPGMQLIGLDKTISALPNGGQPTGRGMKWRLTGTITNNGPDVVSRPQLSGYFQNDADIPEDGNYRALLCVLDDQTGGGIQPGQTLTIEPKWCPDIGSHNTVGRYMRLKVDMGRSSAQSSLVSYLKLEYAAG